MVKIIFKFFIVISCLLVFRGLVAEPLLDGADLDYGEYLSGQCLTCHQNSSDEGIISNKSVPEDTIAPIVDISTLEINPSTGAIILVPFNRLSS